MPAYFNSLIQDLAEATWEIDDLKQVGEQFCTRHQITLGEFASTLRTFLLNQEVGPELFLILMFLGQAESLRRLRAWAEFDVPPQPA